MTFTARSAAEIRDTALANWRTRYLLLSPPRDLDISEGSDAYNEIDALSFEFEGTELGAQEAAHRVLLRYAFGDDLDLFAEDDGTARKPASAARRVVRVSGAPSTSTPVGSATLSAATGQRFTPIDATTGAPLTAITPNGSGLAEVTIECTTTGTGGNLNLGTILTWSSAPTGFATTGTLVEGASAREGENAETDDALRERLLERRRERPASGNRADWRAWAQACAGVGDAFVHCATQPTGGPSRPAPVPNRRGNVLVLAVRPSPAADSYVQNADGTLGAGLSPSYKRPATQGLCDLVRAYIDGTQDAQGHAVADSAQTQLYPAPIDGDNWAIEAPADAATEVIIDAMLEGGAGAFAFDGTRTLTAVASVTQVTMSDVTGLSLGKSIAIRYAAVGSDGLPSVIRGGWALATVNGVNPGTGVVTFSNTLPALPSIGALVRSDPGVWDRIRAGVLRYFDSLGPGAPSGLERSQRFPDTTWGAQANVVPSRLLVASLAVASVTDAEVVTPASTGTTLLAYQAVPSVITIRRKVA